LIHETTNLYAARLNLASKYWHYWSVAFMRGDEIGRGSETALLANVHPNQTNNKTLALVDLFF
jgi:hypothetical protein